jgi:sphinganine-1-phosphate aldolase
VPPWDFRVPGVTSLSADIHKYGYTFKGASAVLYRDRDRDLLQRQVFMYDSWPGGLYASSSSAGTRSGAPIAGAWAAINHLGEEGYLRLTLRVLDATTRLRSGITAIDGLRIHFDPDLSLFEFGSDTVDMNAVCDVMDGRGWNLDRQPGGLHMMVSPGHDRIVDAFLGDLEAAVANHTKARRGDHVYGGVVI